MDTSGQRIKQRRKALGISQGDLARRIGIAQSTLSEIESGESKMPSAETLVGLARELKVSKSWIITGKNGEIEALPEEYAPIIRKLDAMTVEQRRAVYQLVNIIIPGSDDDKPMP